ncbi:MAG: AMP-binding protein, partial [Bradymonadaceae bacterium]
GPTEATIAISAYRWNEPSSARQCRQGIAPIGTMFPGQKALIIGDDDVPLPPGERGELLLAGSQVTRRYWENPEKTQERYVCLPHSGDTLWYRTGDLVEADDDGQMYFFGRVDDQIKLRGHRVELQEIDVALRKACGSELAMVVGWPVTAEGVAGVVGFVSSDGDLGVEKVLERCRETLPQYMVPQRIIVIGEFPRNASQKIDRRALGAMLDAGEFDRGGSANIREGDSESRQPSL